MRVKVETPSGGHYTVNTFTGEVMRLLKAGPVKNAVLVRKNGTCIVRRPGGKVYMRLANPRDFRQKFVRQIIARSAAALESAERGQAQEA